MFRNQTIISLCTGVRGLDRGVEQAIGATRTVAFVEIEAFIVENLLAGMQAGLVDAAPIWCNLKTFPARRFRGKVHGIIGGYPCQPFSHAGKRKGTDDPRHLWPYIQQHIAAIGPVWCFFENVSGHLTLGFSEVRQSLWDMGYAVEAGIFTAEEVGAPHERERLFILAIDREWLAEQRGNVDDTKGSRSRGGIRELHRTDAGIGQPKEQYENEGRQFIDASRNEELGNARSIEPRRLSDTEGWQQDSQIGKPSEMGNAEYYGYATSEDLRRGDSASIECEERKGEACQLERTNRCYSCTSVPRCKELGNAESECQRKQSDETITQPNEGVTGYEPEYTSELAHARLFGQAKRQEYAERAIKHSEGRWPSRPGEPQHEWEEPRTISRDRLPATVQKIWRKCGKDIEKMLGKEVRTEANTGEETGAEPGMGGAANGYNYREDLLRAYGNGVVADTAALAFLELMGKHGLTNE